MRLTSPAGLPRLVLWTAVAAATGAGGAACVHRRVAEQYTTAVVERDVERGVGRKAMHVHWHDVDWGVPSCAGAASVADPLDPAGSRIVCEAADTAGLDVNAIRGVHDHLANVGEWAGRFMQVVPTAPQLALRSPGGTLDGVSDELWGDGCPETCGHVNLQKTPLRDVLSKIGGDGASTLLPRRADNSSQGVDLVVLVTYLPLPAADGDVTAWGGVCVVDKLAGIPRLAFLNINPRRTQPATPAEHDLLAHALRHQLLHILGFSSMYWSSPLSTIAANRPVPAFSPTVRTWIAAHTQCPEAHLSPYANATGNGSGFEGMYWMETPSYTVTKAFTDRAVANPNIDLAGTDGKLLYPGHAAVHWNARMWSGEVMSEPHNATGLEGGYPNGVVSGLTLAYFKGLNAEGGPISTDWVSVASISLEEQLMWSVNKTCEWFKAEASVCPASAAQPPFGDFCKVGSEALVSQNDLLCTRTGFAKGGCTGRLTDAIVDPVQQTVSAGCAIVAPDVICSDTRQTPSHSIERFGASSRCVEGRDIGAVCVETCCAVMALGATPQYRLYLHLPNASDAGRTIRYACDPALPETAQVATGPLQYGNVSCPNPAQVCGRGAAAGPQYDTGVERFAVTPDANPLYGFDNVTMLMEVLLSVPVDGPFDLTVRFPLDSYYPTGGMTMGIQEEIPLEIVAPLDVENDTPQVVKAYWTWATRTVLIKATVTCACDAFAWRLPQFTAVPPPFTREGFTYGAYEVVLSAVGTVFRAAMFDPPSDNPVIDPLAPLPPVPPPSTACYCYGRGTCGAAADSPVIPGLNHSCTCDPGYTGRFCHIEVCSTGACGTHGSCSSDYAFQNDSTTTDPAFALAYHGFAGDAGWAGGGTWAGVPVNRLLPRAFLGAAATLRLPLARPAVVTGMDVREDFYVLREDIDRSVGRHGHTRHPIDAEELRVLLGESPLDTGAKLGGYYAQLARDGNATANGTATANATDGGDGSTTLAGTSATKKRIFEQGRFAQSAGVDGLGWFELCPDTYALEALAVTGRALTTDGAAAYAAAVDATAGAAVLYNESLTQTMALPALQAGQLQAAPYHCTPIPVPQAAANLLHAFETVRVGWNLGDASVRVASDSVHSAVIVSPPPPPPPSNVSADNATSGAPSAGAPDAMAHTPSACCDVYFDVTVGWLHEGVFTLAVNISDVGEVDFDPAASTPWENHTAANASINHQPFNTSAFAKARVVWGADYATDERTVHEVGEHVVSFEVDARRLPETDRFYAEFGAGGNFTTPYQKNVTVTVTRDAHGVVPAVTSLVLPGSLLEWVARDEVPAGGRFAGEQPLLRRNPADLASSVDDAEILITAPLASQNIFLTFGGDGTAASALSHAVQNTMSYRAHRCACADSVAAEGDAAARPVYRDTSDAYCLRCAPVGATSDVTSISTLQRSAAYPPGDCTSPCPCLYDGMCDASGKCHCTPNHAGDLCDRCAPHRYPHPTCDVVCHPDVTCLGRGKCNGYGQCVCDPKYTGARCEMRACNDAAYGGAQCNGYGQCYALQDPFFAFRLLSEPGNSADPALWADELSALRNRDWDSESSSWWDGGEDTFDGWGRITLCTSTVCERLPHLNANPVGTVAPMGFSIGKAMGVLWVGWVNSAVFVLTLEVDSGPECWLEFGGTYGAPSYRSRNISEEIAVQQTGTSIRAREIFQDGRPDVLYVMAKATAGAYTGDLDNIESAYVNANTEQIRTPRVAAGDGAPLGLVIHWGHDIVARRDAAMEIAALAANAAQPTRCRACNPRAGVWCDKCANRYFPAPVRRANPPLRAPSAPATTPAPSASTVLPSQTTTPTGNSTTPPPPTPAPHADPDSCMQNCNCIGQDANAPCDERGFCRCQGNRGGQRCDECLPHYYGWPSCDAYCHPFFTCGGKGVCNEAGRCECFFGFTGFSCQRRVCKYDSCGTVFNEGASVCASPADSANKLLWKIGEHDENNWEFKMPLSKVVAHGPLRLNQTSSRREMPPMFAGPDLKASTSDGLTAGENNPITIKFDLPPMYATGACWLTSEDPMYESRYSYSVVNEAACRELPSGQWHTFELCHDRQGQRYVFVDNCLTGDRELQRVISPQSGYSLMFKVINPNRTEPARVVYTVNNRTVGVQMQTALNTNVRIPTDLLYWGASNNTLTVEIVQGGALAIDYIAFEATTNANRVLPGMESYYATPERALVPDHTRVASATLGSAGFKVYPDLITEVYYGALYFTEGVGVKPNDQIVQTFNRYGYFVFCLTEYLDCVRLVIRVGPTPSTWPFTLRGVAWKAVSTFSSSVLTLTVAQTSHLEALLDFDLKWGGNYSALATGRASAVTTQETVVNNFRTTAHVLTNYYGAKDAYVGAGMHAPGAAPQLHAVVLAPYSELPNDGGSRAAMTVTNSYTELYRGAIVTSEQVKVTRVAREAHVFLQWGFTPLADLEQYMFEVLRLEEHPTCSCRPPFTGENCDQCGEVDCTVPQCFDARLCGACAFPNAGENCHSCVKGYTPTITSVTGPAQCAVECEAVGSCSSRGECIFPDICRCFPGFYGESCDALAACIEDCVGDGYTDCVESRCVPAVRPGLTVEVALCPYGCRHGRCDRAAASCVCDNGWQGVDCSSPICDGGQTCFGHGLCVQPSTCQCEVGWGGINCETSPCGMHPSCTECTATPGCGWCGLTDECVPGAAATGPYLPSNVSTHACATYPHFFKTDECFVGYTTALPTPRPSSSVGYLNCTTLCIKTGLAAHDCVQCRRTYVGNTYPGFAQAPLESLEVFAGAWRGAAVLQDATPGPDGGGEVAVGANATGDGEASCTTVWSVFDWMPPALRENYICACTIERSLRRDARGACLEAAIRSEYSNEVNFPASLKAEGKARRDQYNDDASSLARLSTCCATYDTCCDLAALRRVESDVLAHVNWFTDTFFERHRAAYDAARRTCGCTEKCINHLRDGIWWMLIQVPQACSVGGLSTVLLHPCELAVDVVLRRVLPPLTPEITCTLGHELVPQTVTLPQTAAQEVLWMADLATDLPTCEQWTNSARWTCCNTALGCYANCSVSVDECHEAFIACVAATLECPALLGVQQRLDDPAEPSQTFLEYATTKTYSAAPIIRARACPCRPTYSEVHPTTISVPNVNGGINALCFDGWTVEPMTGQCDTPLCATSCNGHGVCTTGALIPQCKCQPGWTGADCGAMSHSYASAFGLGHLTTFDGAFYSVFGSGSYWLLRGLFDTTDPAADEVAIQTGLSYNASLGVSLFDAFSIKYGRDSANVWMERNTSYTSGVARVLVKVNNEVYRFPDDAFNPAFFTVITRFPPDPVYVKKRGVTFYTVFKTHAMTGTTGDRRLPEHWNAAREMALFFEVRGHLRAKVVATYSESLKRYLLSLDVSLPTASYAAHDGLFRTADGSPENDIAGYRPELRLGLKGVWQDYNVFGELFRVGERGQNILPVYFIGDGTEGGDNDGSSGDGYTNSSSGTAGGSANATTGGGVPLINPSLTSASATLGQILPNRHFYALHEVDFAQTDWDVLAEEALNVTSGQQRLGGRKLSESRKLAAMQACQGIGARHRRGCEFDHYVLGGRDLYSSNSSEFLQANTHCSEVNVAGAVFGDNAAEVAVRHACFLRGICGRPGDADLCQCATPTCTSARCLAFPDIGADPSCRLPAEAATLRRLPALRRAARSLSTDPSAYGPCSALNWCSSHGVCATDAIILREDCDCDPTWAGEQCQIPICDDTCANGGRCGAVQERVNGVLTTSARAGCVCPPGYTGPSCSDIADCPEVNNCNGHGLCDYTGGCACHSGWAGTTCDVHDMTQTCPPGVGGRWCTVPQCPNACSGHGYCAVEDGAPVCKCAMNWYAASCDVFCIADITCTGHGVCDTTGRCKCDTIYRTFSCEVVDPTIRVPQTAELLTKPSRHAEGIPLHLEVAINGGRSVPEGMVLRWSSFPNGLFGATSENKLSVTVYEVPCLALVYSGADSLVSECSYDITAMLLDGVTVLASDTFNVVITPAPIYSRGLEITTDCGDPCVVDELVTELQINAGLWRSTNPPFTYRLEVHYGSLVYPVKMDGQEYEFQADPVARFVAPPLPCGITADNATAKFVIYVKSQSNAVASLEVPRTVLVRRLPLPRLREVVQAIPYPSLANTSGSGAGDSGAASPNAPPQSSARDRQQDIYTLVHAYQRLLVAEWDWPLIYELLEFMGSTLPPPTSVTAPYWFFVLNGLSEMLVILWYPGEPPACGRLAAGKTTDADYVTFASDVERIRAQQERLVSLFLARIEGATTSSVRGLLEYASYLRSPAAQFAALEDIAMLAGSGQTLRGGKVTLSTYANAAPSSNYAVKDTVIYLNHLYAPYNEGYTLLLTTTAPDQEIYETTKNVTEDLSPVAVANGNTNAREGLPEVEKDFKVTLQSEVVALQLRDPATGKGVTVALDDTSAYVAYVVFTITKGINVERGYECVYWEGGWHWGVDVGIGPLLPVPDINDPVGAANLRPSGSVFLSYACPVSQLGRYALARIEEIKATPQPSIVTTPEPVVYTPIDTDTVFPDIAKGAASNETQTIVLACVGALLGLIVLGFVLYKVRQHLKRGEGDLPGAQRKMSIARRASVMYDKKRAASAARDQEAERAAAKQSQPPTTTTLRKEALERLGKVDTAGNVALPPPPAEADGGPEMDKYFAQRDLAYIETIVKMDDLPTFDPTRPVGTARYVYPVDGDSGSDSGKDDELHTEHVASPRETGASNGASTRSQMNGTTTSVPAIRMSDVALSDAMNTTRSHPRGGGGRSPGGGFLHGSDIGSARGGGRTPVATPGSAFLQPAPVTPGGRRRTAHFVEGDVAEGRK